MKSIFSITILLCAFSLNAQEFVLIKFTDKPSAPTYLNNPTSMLTQKSIDRRAKYNIPITEQDAPVEQNYLNEIIDLGVQPVAVSKWFNGVFAELTSTQISQLQNLTFVDEIETFVKNTTQPLVINEVQKNTLAIDMTDFNYGFTEQQVTQLKLEYLHNLGFTGEGISIAVIDAGFPGVDTAEGFAYIRNNNQIKGGFNFVDNNENIYARGTHGTVVLSTIGGYLENQFVGTAIDADFYLYISEKSEEEIPQEEAWWIVAAEQADYEGVDVINTSLGYSTFDDWRYNYDYADMNGQTAFISRGAKIAAEKGMMLVTSAGNSGNSEWHYITAPADVENVLTIGAVDEFGNPSGFSSYGPTSDGRIKPDVSARGSQAFVIRPEGEISTSSGTSFSSPIMAGAMACFIQAYPNVLPAQLREEVRKSASLYPNHTNQMGYGIPDFSKAYDDMSVAEVSTPNEVQIFPNPTKGILNIHSNQAIHKVEIISIHGKVVKSINHKFDGVNINDLSTGVYLVKVQLESGEISTQKIIKR